MAPALALAFGFGFGLWLGSPSRLLHCILKKGTVLPTIDAQLRLQVKFI
jgi:hypothetical protein